MSDIQEAKCFEYTIKIFAPPPSSTYYCIRPCMLPFFFVNSFRGFFCIHIQPFWRLLDTNKQRGKQSIYDTWYLFIFRKMEIDFSSQKLNKEHEYQLFACLFLARLNSKDPIIWNLISQWNENASPWLIFKMADQKRCRNSNLFY